LDNSPDAVLFVCESERGPTSHPAYRDRILFLHKEKQGQAHAVEQSSLQGAAYK